MICVKQPYCNWLIEGIKTMEIRTRIPNQLNIGDKIIVVEKNSGGKVVGSFIVKEICMKSPYILGLLYYDKHKVPHKELMKYAGEKRMLIGIVLQMDEYFYPNRHISDYGFSRTPQWFAEVCKTGF